MISIASGIYRFGSTKDFQDSVDSINPLHFKGTNQMNATVGHARK